MTHRSRKVRGILGSALAGSLAASLLALVPAVAASAPLPAPLRHLASGSLPTVTQIPPGSGSHGYPYDAVPTSPSFPGAPTINLAHYGYVEREFTDVGHHQHLPAERLLGLQRRVERVGGAEQRPVHHAPARALPDESREVQRDRGGRVAQRHHRRRPGPGVVGDLPRGPLPGLRLRRRDRRRRAAWTRTRPGIRSATARWATATTASPTTSSARRPRWPGPTPRRCWAA